MPGPQISLNSVVASQENALIASTKRGFYKISFEILRNGIPIYIQTLTVNPEAMSADDAAYVTVTPTLNGFYVDDFGLGPTTYNIKGTTGFGPKRNAEGTVVDGYAEIKNLRDRIYRYFLEPDGVKKERQTDDFKLIYHDWLMGDHYVVQPVGKFQLARNKQRPTMFAYDFTFVTLYPTEFGVSLNNRDVQDTIWQNTQSPTIRLQDHYNTMLDGANLLRILTSSIF